MNYFVMVDGWRAVECFASLEDADMFAADLKGSNRYGSVTVEVEEDTWA